MGEKLILSGINSPVSVRFNEGKKEKFLAPNRVKSCRRCGKQFEHYTPNAVYCGNICREAWKKEIKDAS